MVQIVCVVVGFVVLLMCSCGIWWQVKLCYSYFIGLYWKCVSYQWLKVSWVVQMVVMNSICCVCGMFYWLRLQLQNISVQMSDCVRQLVRVMWFMGVSMVMCDSQLWLCSSVMMRLIQLRQVGRLFSISRLWVMFQLL